MESEAVQSPYGTVPQSFKHRLLAQKPTATAGGSVRVADTTNFPVAKTTAAALVEIKPGAMRGIHWHPNNDEFQYYISGQARMTVFATNGRARTFDYRVGDVCYVPTGYVHYVQNTGNETVWFLEGFKSDRFLDISVDQMMAVTPPNIIASNLNVGPEFVNALNKEQCPVVPCSNHTILSGVGMVKQGLNSWNR